ncbi:hypothetical protein NL676_021363 [Syzygium grande]|nr:hypothetical protein NL676_021363 [Syzygium grande]
MLPPNSTVETKTQEEPTPINPETEVPLPLCPPDDLKLAKRKALSERLGPRTKEWKHKRFRPVPTTKRVTSSVHTIIGTVVKAFDHPAEMRSGRQGAAIPKSRIPPVSTRVEDPTRGQHAGHAGDTRVGRGERRGTDELGLASYQAKTARLAVASCYWAATGGLAVAQGGRARRSSELGRASSARRKLPRAGLKAATGGRRNRRRGGWFKDHQRERTDWSHNIRESKTKTGQNPMIEHVTFAAKKI